MPNTQLSCLVTNLPPESENQSVYLVQHVDVGLVRACGGRRSLARPVLRGRSPVLAIVLVVALVAAADVAAADAVDLVLDV